MHIKINVEKIKTILEIVSKISTKHLTLPILQCVLLEVKENSLIIKATNLEIGIECSIKCSVVTDGVVAVPAQILLQTINLITQKDLTLEIKKNILLISTIKSQTKIKTISPDDFPNIPKISQNGQKINGNTFAEGIKSTAFTSSQSLIKPELGSIYILQKSENSLTFVATDSFRLIEKTTPQPKFILNNSILIPHKNAIEIAQIIDNYNSDVIFYINENQCAFKVDDIYITSRLIVGNFPDYEQIIPKEYISHVTTLTYDFHQALKKTNIFLNKFMQLTLDVSGSKMLLSSESGDVGTTEEEISASIDGENIKLHFNQKYINEVLQYINDESIVIHFAGIGRPIVIEGVHDKSLQYLVMPMNK